MKSQNNKDPRICVKLSERTRMLMRMYCCCNGVTVSSFVEGLIEKFFADNSFDPAGVLDGLSGDKDKTGQDV